MGDGGEGGEDRGRGAERPRDIPARGWRDIARRVRREIKHDNLSIVAGGVAFYAFLAVFPALAALIAVYGLVANPADVQTQFAVLRGVLPQQAHQIVEKQLVELASHSSRGLGFGLLVSITLSLWSATKGTKALITALDIAFGEEETRGLFKLNAVALALTIGGILVSALAIGAVVAIPAILAAVGASSPGAFLISWLRWPALAVAIMTALSLLYRYAPARRHARWQWATPGAALATVLWLAGSVLFSWYVSNFGKYDKVYGSLAVIVILLTWLLLSAYVVVLGAEVNAEIERQTAADSTTGPPAPLGRRGAFAADTVGDTP